MLKSLTIRQRILVTFLAMVLISSIVQLIIAGRQLQQATLEFYQHDIETSALMIATNLSEPFEHILDEEDSASADAILANLQQDENLNFLVIDRNYRVLSFTENTGYENINTVPETPDLATAKNGQIGADIRKGYDGSNHLYVAIGIQYEGKILGYLVLSRPMQPAYAEVYQQWFELSFSTFPVIVLVILTSLWLSGTISRPIQQLRNSAMKMADGVFDTRIKTTSKDEVGELANTFNHMAKQIEALIKTQRSFVSNAAHELRTPLMTLKLRVEALEDESLPLQERTQYLKEIHTEIDHMAELVSSLLILARIDEGRHTRDGAITDTTSALQDIARYWRITAAKTHLTFDMQLPDSLPDLPLSPNDFRLVLDNLIGNAIKYTSQGEVRLTVDHKVDELVIQVADTGIGFDPAIGEQLFTRFFRTDETRVNFEGIGLGLSIVQVILEQYGATITANSQGMGKGAVFTVHLPCTPQ